MSDLRTWMTLLEGATGPEPLDPLKQWVEAVAADAHSEIGRAWVRQQMPGYAEGFQDQARYIARYGESIARMVRQALPYVDQHRPNGIESLDVSDVFTRYAVPDYIAGLLSQARSAEVRRWIRTAIPAHIQQIGAMEFFEHPDWAKRHAEAVAYLNTHPPGRADTPVRDVLDMMRHPERHQPVTKLKGLTHTPGFVAWFGKSAVVDKLGRPLVVFRGTRRPAEPHQIGDDTRLNTASFTSSPEIASVYALTSDKLGFGDLSYKRGSNVAPYYLSIQNPVKLMDAKVTVADAISEIAPTADYATTNVVDQVLDILRYLEYRRDHRGNISLTLPSNGLWEHDFDDLCERVEKLAARGRGERIEDLMQEIELDSYVIADCAAFVAWAAEQGFDGIIHRDVFGGTGMKALSLATSKAADDVAALDWESDDDATFITYRPFQQSQIKSVFNAGQFDPTKPHVSESTP